MSLNFEAILILTKVKLEYKCMMITLQKIKTSAVIQKLNHHHQTIPLDLNKIYQEI